MSEYIKQQSVGELFRNTLEIFFGHWPSILGPYVLLLLPLLVIQQLAVYEGAVGAAVLVFLLSMPVSFFAYGIVVVSISEVCLGSTPSMLRSFKHVFSSVFWTLAGVSLLQGLAILIGLVLLVVPGVVFLTWFAFAPVVVILDGTAGMQAFRRSRSLASGYHLRTFSVLVLWFIVLVIVSGVSAGILGAMQADPVVFSIGFFAVQLIVQALMVVTLTLLYYDLRVRKEAYSTAGLAEDLAR